MKWYTMAPVLLIVGGLAADARAWDAMRFLGVGYGEGYHAENCCQGWGIGGGSWYGPSAASYAPGCCEHPETCCDNVWAGYWSEHRCGSLWRQIFHRGCDECESACHEPGPACHVAPACCESEPCSDNLCGRLFNFTRLFSRRHDCCEEETCCEPEPTCCESEPCSDNLCGRLFNVTRLFSRRHDCCEEETCGEPEPCCDECGGRRLRLFGWLNRFCPWCAEDDCCHDAAYSEAPAADHLEAPPAPMPSTSAESDAAPILPLENAT